jgi:hypothetical protein
MEVLLINNDDLTRSTILGGSIDVDKLVPAMKAAQKTMIKPILPKELYDKICLDFLNDALTGDYFTLWNDYLRDMLIYASAEIYINSGAYTISNNGITKLVGEGAVTINKDELSSQVEFYRRLYNITKDDMNEWLKTTNLISTKNCKMEYIRVGGMLLKKPKQCK